MLPDCRGRPGNPSDLAAASQLASFCWQGIRRLKRWPLLRLLKLAAAFGLATPERMAAWQVRAVCPGRRK